jgi:hypothetical protein
MRLNNDNTIALRIYFDERMPWLLLVNRGGATFDILRRTHGGVGTWECGELELAGFAETEVFTRYDPNSHAHDLDERVAQRFAAEWFNDQLAMVEMEGQVCTDCVHRDRPVAPSTEAPCHGVTRDEAVGHVACGLWEQR